jgi:tRNA uridine 5-carbamoylmethylation protein Kti12
MLYALLLFAPLSSGKERVAHKVLRKDSRQKHRHLSGKNDKLVVYFTDEIHKDYDYMWASTKMEFDGLEFWMDYKITNGPEKCSDWDPCYFAIVDKKCKDAKIDENYIGNIDYSSTFDFTSTEDGDAAGRMWDLDINESNIKGKYMVLIGHTDKFSRRALKSGKSSKDGMQILACGEIEKD